MLSVGVGHEVQSLPDVRRTEPRSAGIDRPDGVARTFQVSVYSVEPSESVLARNLLAKDCDRSTLRDETEELGPEMPSVVGAAPFSCGGEGLARTGAGPDGAIVGPSGGSKGVAPHSDASKEVALIVSHKVIRSDIDDGTLIHFSWSDMPLLDKFMKPRCGLGVELVVVGGHFASP
jgi:hypothetical protein